MARAEIPLKNIPDENLGQFVINRLRHNLKRKKPAAKNGANGSAGKAD